MCVVQQAVWRSDNRLGRSHPDPRRAARTGHSVLFGGPQGDFATETSDHTRMRELLQPHFSPARVRALRPQIEQFTNDLLLDDLAGQDRPADLMQPWRYHCRCW
jgi:cytochrome P450